MQKVGGKKAWRSDNNSSKGKRAGVEEWKLLPLSREVLVGVSARKKMEWQHYVFQGDHPKKNKKSKIVASVRLSWKFR